MRTPILHVTYLGGHPAQRFGSKVESTVVLDDAGVHVRRFKDAFCIDWWDIQDVTVEGPEELTRRVTATRVVALGVVALATKKKSGSCYLGIRTQGYEAKFQVERMSASQLRALFGPWMSRIHPSAIHPSARIQRLATLDPPLWERLR